MSIFCSQNILKMLKSLIFKSHVDTKPNLKPPKKFIYGDNFTNKTEKRQFFYDKKKETIKPNVSFSNKANKNKNKINSNNPNTSNNNADSKMGYYDSKYKSILRMKSFPNEKEMNFPELGNLFLLKGFTGEIIF